MEFYQLEAFIAVVEEGSFSRAAERVFRTQSAVSQAIKKLEEELNVPLLDRAAGSLIPTQAGHLVLEYARRVVGQRGQFLRSLEQLSKAASGKVTIAAFESAALYVLPEPLRAFHHRFPAVEIEVLRRPDEIIAHQVLERAADIGFIIQDPPFKELRTFELFSDPLILIAGPRHRLAKAGGAHIRDLADERFFVHHVRSQTTQRVMSLFEEYETPLHIAARLWSYENVKEFVKEGMGVAILPAVCVQTELREGTLVHVKLAELTATRKIQIIHTDEQYLAVSARELLSLLRSWKWAFPR